MQNNKKCFKIEFIGGILPKSNIRKLKTVRNYMFKQEAKMNARCIAAVAQIGGGIRRAYTSPKLLEATSKKGE